MIDEMQELCEIPRLKYFGFNKWSKEQRFAAHLQLKSGQMTVREIAQITGGNPRYISGFHHKYGTLRIKPSAPHKGATKTIPTHIINEIKDHINKRDSLQQCQSLDSYREYIEGKLRNCGRIQQGSKMNHLLFQEVLTQIEGRIRKAQIKPIYNAKAHADLRNFISFAAAIDALVKDLHPSQIINADMTNAGVGGDATNVTIVTDDHNEGVPIQMESKSNDLKHSIKYMACWSANGQSSIPVYVIPSSKANVGATSIWEKVKGLGSGTDTESKGWLCILGSDGLSLDWCNVIIPFTLSVRRPEHKKTVFMYDSERIGINLFEGDSEDLQGIRKEIEDAGILVLKIPAACTAKLQPCD